MGEYLIFRLIFVQTWLEVLVMARGRGSTKQLKRRRPFRRPRERILIVCEGEKTERLYFSLYLDLLRAVNVDLILCGKECGSDPSSVVKFAIDKFNGDGQIDHCYCVIDRDTHDGENFRSAIEDAQAIGKKLPKTRSFQTAVSYPCFEYWLLCHFVYTRAPFAPKGKKSPGDCAVDAVKNHLPGYTKSSREELAKLLPQTEAAIVNSKRALAEAKATSELNPSSEVHELVIKIQSAIG